MKESTASKYLAMWLLSSVCLPAGLAVAQGEPGADGDRVIDQEQSDSDQTVRLGRVDVTTARKREEALKDVPISIEAFSGEDLFNTRKDNLEDLAAGLSNVNFAADSTSRSRIAIRGIGPDNTGSQGPGVGFFIDGVYQNSTSQMNTPFFDLERVEVLKGPQGTLYGRNSLAGVINFITPKPDNEFNAAIEAEVASFETRSIAGAVGGALIQDQLFGRVSVQHRTSDGPYDNVVTGEPAYPLESNQIRGRLVWQASPNLEFDLTGNHSTLDGAAFIYSQVADIQNLSENYAGDARSISNIMQDDVNLKATYSFENFDVRSLTSYYKQDWEYDVDADTGPANLLRVTDPVENTVWSQELRFLSTHDGPFQWLFGGEYADTQIDSANEVTGPFIDFAFANAGGPGVPLNALYPSLPASGYGSGTYSQTNRELWAAFADVTYELNDKVELGFGLRYDSVEQDFGGVSTINNPIGTPLPQGIPSVLPGVIPPLDGTTPLADLETTQEEWQPKATVTVDWTDTFTSFASISKGFRQGGFNSIAAGTPQESWTGDIVWNYEMGFRWEDAAGRANLEGAVFFLDWQDATGTVIFGPGQVGVLNLGDAESTGVELSGAFAVNEHITLSGGAGLLNCEYVEANPSAQAIFEGNQCLDSSEWTFNAASDFVHPLGDTGYDFTARVNVIGRGDTAIALHNADEPSRRIQEAYYLTNLSLGIQNEKYTLTVFADNVTDEQYATTLVTQEFGANFGVQSDVAFLGQPATYGIRLRANF